VLGTYGSTAAVTFYAGALCITGTIVLLVWLYATIGHRLVRPDLDAGHGHVLASPRTYDFTIELFFLGRRRTSYQALVVAAGVRPGQRVLDVGCGTGYFSRLVARSVGPNGVVVGIDPSESMIQYARQKTASIGNCEFQVGAAEALPFPGDHFDVVVSSLVLTTYPKICGCVRWTRCGASFDQAGPFSSPRRETQATAFLGVRARAHGYDRMAQQVERLDSLAAAAGFGDIRQGEVPPCLRYIAAVKN
jgi:SAM-dependent methyltransferase